MAFEITRSHYTGKIKEVTLGTGKRTVTVGGETSYPFYLFEGEMPNPPRIAMEIWDMEPEEWPKAVIEPFKDVLKDPAAWAKKCVEECSADMVIVQLKSTDPNGLNKGPGEASATVKKVCEAVDVPVIVWGCGDKGKDVEVLKKVAEDNQGKNLLLGPVEEANHKQIGASAMGFHQAVISSSPIDINLAKQLNVLLDNLGVSPEKIVIDPTTGGLGYGLEYSYSVMERIRMAALTQEDEKLQSPIINNLGNEIWKCKEVKLSLKEAPTLGDPAKRGVMLECIGAVSYLMAGSDILVLRHPESVKWVKEFMNLMMTGDMAMSSDKLVAKLNVINVKPEGDFPKIEKMKVEAKPKEEKKEDAPKASPKEEAKPKPKEEEKIAKKPEVAQGDKAKAEAKAKIEAETEAKARDEAKAKAEEEAERKSEKEAKAKAESEEEAKAVAEAKAKADAKAKEEVEKKAKKEAKAKAEAELEELKAKREREKEKREAKRIEVEAVQAAAGAARHATPAAVHLTHTERIIAYLNRVHKRS
ncbi:MAG: acetyl-CoA synthase [Deltaproteobacteria bacterium CG_4_9_14_3_um_filter_44_9]|nr:MAG: acetyl-CoA synthase [Deltaproteobacteria bacterium CG2_30_43_15]PIU85067.1 MAG: acetyl-CoA synthase [Deltaproteobacteria bacterium CG06_land_8_20_14_3_00_44_19]PIX22908.1 MAG: acetyl-CoA synthase [Deltaproteobacteria bacterium CG_4_8_14_3_um_filter_43_13]PIZ19014.1 MAG: acetyl-CoA synthase [Deltaproteobacteria bacterium CG_4_10_14_0_8_um_filter_43_12]PJB44438.1 MAG: acetyl-CoA synthase [Deltaproteobacteria bacterium CG_4_9_14_3_um_filter_44_9]HCX89635.1 acetyl-CoA synthase [Deltaproteo